MKTRELERWLFEHDATRTQAIAARAARGDWRKLEEVLEQIVEHEASWREIDRGNPDPEIPAAVEELVEEMEGILEVMEAAVDEAIAEESWRAWQRECRDEEGDEWKNL
jgi:hypothetical protein